MNTNYNSMYFENLNEAVSFIEHLHQISKNSDELFNDIHTYMEESGVIVEWVQVPYNHDYGGQFKYVGEDQYIMTEYKFPDNHYEYLNDIDEYEERLNDWLKENPGWKLTSYGMWTNTIENEKFKEALNEDKEQ